MSDRPLHMITGGAARPARASRLSFRYWDGAAGSGSHRQGLRQPVGMRNVSRALVPRKNVARWLDAGAARCAPSPLSASPVLR